MNGRMLANSLAVTLFLLPAPGVVRAAFAQDRPAATFRSSVDVVSVSAVVRDRKGRFVSNLTTKDFIVAEGGQPRPILDFQAQADGPVKLALLFDISGSMRVGTKAVDAQQTARVILSALKRGDEAAVFAFDTGLDRVSSFTSDVASLISALDRIDRPYGQTSIYDAVAATAKAIAAQGPGGGRMPQRSAVVLLTDGIDTRSRLTSEQVSEIASSIDIPVYVIAVMATIDDPRAAPRTTTSPDRCRTWRARLVARCSPRAHRHTRALRRGRSSTSCGTSICSRSKRRAGRAGSPSKFAPAIAASRSAPAPGTRRGTPAWMMRSPRNTDR
jgi:hypothetical protein